MKKLIILLTLSMIVCLKCLAQKQSPTDHLDSLKVKHSHIVAATQAFIELRYYKRIDSANMRLLDFRQSQIEALDHSLGYYKAAYNQCDGVTVPSLKESIKVRDHKIVEIQEQIRKDKARAFGKGFGTGLGIGVALETAIILIVKFAIPKK